MEGGAVTWPAIIRSVEERIHDGQARDKELRAIWRDMHKKTGQSAMPCPAADPTSSGLSVAARVDVSSDAVALADSLSLPEPAGAKTKGPVSQEIPGWDEVFSKGLAGNPPMHGVEIFNLLTAKGIVPNEKVWKDRMYPSLKAWSKRGLLTQDKQGRYGLKDASVKRKTPAPKKPKKPIAEPRDWRSLFRQAFNGHESLGKNDLLSELRKIGALDESRENYNRFHTALGHHVGQGKTLRKIGTGTYALNA